MHRSGTSVVAEILAALGVFIGKHRDEHAEALFFQGINEWLFAQVNAAWDRPANIGYLTANREARKLASRVVGCHMKSLAARDYLGWWRYLRWRDPRRLDVPWGWKDPRTTWTLPIWEDVVGSLRTIHVLRHGIDVANSLQAFQTAEFNSQKKNFEYRMSRPGWMRALYCRHIAGDRMAGSLRSMDFTECMDLWKAYVTQARNTARSAGPFLEVRYEDLVETPRETIEKIAEFAGLSPTTANVERAAAMVRPGGAFRYRDSRETIKQAKRYEHELSTAGYEA